MRTEKEIQEKINTLIFSKNQFEKNSPKETEVDRMVLFALKRQIESNIDLLKWVLNEK